MDPQTYVRRFLDFASRSSLNHVWFTLVTNQGGTGAEPNQQPSIASYALGDLIEVKGRLSGQARAYFSDRRTPGPVIAPFDEHQTDTLGVDIALNGDGVAITLTAHDWGDAQQTLTELENRDGVLVATGGSVGNQTPGATYVISLAQATAPT